MSELLLASYATPEAPFTRSLQLYWIRVTAPVFTDHVITFLGKWSLEITQAVKTLIYMSTLCFEGSGGGGGTT